MIYYILLILIILSARYVVFQFPFGTRRDRIEQRFCYLIWAIIVLMAALRNLSVGADTLGYYNDYLNIEHYSFQYIRERYEGYLGFFYLSKIFTLLGAPYQVWFGAVELIYAYSLMVFINKFSKDKLFSILVFVAVGLFPFSLAGLKQVVAMAFMLLAFVKFIDKKYLYTSLLLCLSYLTHPASLIFLAAFPLYYLKRKPYFLQLVLLSSLICVVSAEVFLTTMVDVLKNEHFESYLEKNTSYTATTLIYYIAILIMSYFGLKSYKKYDLWNANFFWGLSIIVCAMQSLAAFSPNMFRLALCYCPAMMILIPNVSYYSNNKPERWVIMSSMVFYFLYAGRNSGYSFFWDF